MPLCVSVLTTLGRRTDESGCGSWPTIRASDAVHGGVTQQGNGQGAESLTSLAAKWQTPSATCADAGATSRSGDRKGELLLGGQVREAENWLTPKAADGRAKGTTTGDILQNHLDNGELVGQANLADAAGQPDPASPSTNGKPRGSLNSAWVAQLMSWPDEYMLALTELLTEYHLTKPRPQRTKACSG